MLGGLLVDANVTQNMPLVWKNREEQRKEYVVRFDIRVALI